MVIRGVVLALGILACVSGEARAQFDIDRSRCKAETAYVAEVEQLIDDPLLRKFHSILMDNELDKGCGALQFTDARMQSNTNGFSFGLSQFDLATRPEKSLSALNAILACSEKELGTPVLSRSEMEFLRRKGSRATSVLRTDRDAWSKFIALRPKIETALNTSCGKRLATEAYLGEIRSFQPHVRRLWKAVLADNPELASAEAFFKLEALDLRNVLGGADGFIEYLENRSAIVCFRLCAKKIVPRFTIPGKVAVSDFIRYPLEQTCYGHVPQVTRRQDQLRRLERVLREVDLTALPLTDRDRAYLTGDFAAIVASTRAMFPKLNTGSLDRLIALASPGGVARPVSAVPLDKATVNRLAAICDAK